MKYIFLTLILFCHAQVMHGTRHSTVQAELARIEKEKRYCKGIMVLSGCCAAATSYLAVQESIGEQDMEMCRPSRLAWNCAGIAFFVATAAAATWQRYNLAKHANKLVQRR